MLTWAFRFSCHAEAGAARSRDAHRDFHNRARFTDVRFDSCLQFTQDARGGTCPTRSDRAGAHGAAKAGVSDRGGGGFDEEVAVGDDEVVHAHRGGAGELFDGVGGAGEEAVLEVDHDGADVLADVASRRGIAAAAAWKSAIGRS